MRKPSSQDELYRWHNAALRGENPPVFEDEPQCGWFKFRFVRGGPWVPVRITCEQVIDEETGELAGPEMMRAEVGQNQRPENAHMVWPRCCGRPISEAEWQGLVGSPEFSIMEATHAPVDLARTPLRPVRKRP